ncbi:MAG: RNA-metabolising metallo-beta-lactamase, metallo-beta-lactamase family protein [Candidatus Paceibacter sp.]|jgi:metallo-beta-lactamase family protein|nr:RNA-metabolising metallo-beta-lactamase, metallo-beta-lactamase family protein [Candidatus Paceibacter sp.]
MVLQQKEFHNMAKAKLTFWGGVGTVTGANFLLEIADKKILIDCGLEQGSHFAEEHNRDPFPYDPAMIDYLFVTHAHADHIGRIPKLVHDGFKGVIYSTPATRDLAGVMLPDTLRLIQEEARRSGVLAMYEGKDVEAAFKLWRTIPYYETFEVVNGLSVFPKDSGHILGSTMYEFSYNGKKIVFTGDLGNSPSLFLRDTDDITDANYILMESVYGDRNHESKEERRQKFGDLVRDTIARKRTLVIPAFSLERTQDILYELNRLIEKEGVGEVKVFVDSPLATSVTAIYRSYSNEFKDSARKYVVAGDDLFDFPKLKFTVHREESMHVDNAATPKIIIAGSGMSNGGRVVHHEKRYLPDRNATILMPGYQAANTLGRRILEGAKEVTIDGEKIRINAEVKNIFGYSSHKDSDHLIEFVEKAAEGGKLKKVFVAMGEPKAAMFLVQRLRDYLGVDAMFPKQGETVELDM